MPSLTPWVRRLLIAWGALWILSFLGWLAGTGPSSWLRLDPAGLLAADWRALPGLLGYALVHDPTGILHVGLNALLMAVFGPEVEVLYPRRRFVGFLAVAALCGAAVHVLLAVFSPFFGYAVVGGSGLVMAVVAVQAAVYPGRRVSLVFFELSMRTFFLALVALDVLWSAAAATGKGRGVAADVHLAGAGWGWLFARGFGALPRPLERAWARLREGGARRERERQRRQEEELDRILAKIGRDGMQSLTPGERRFLRRRARRG